jgi:hypothetical protein
MCNSIHYSRGVVILAAKMQKKRILLFSFISSLLGLSYEAAETDKLWGS